MTDVLLLLDGSGSIDAADWAMQLEGYAATVANHAFVPGDGSIAIGVVQWAAGTTRVEIPLTVIDGPTLRMQVLEALEAIQQIRGSTNPGDGVRAGTEHLLAEGRDGARWTLCMSTDGVTNSGESLTTATAYARDAGVDRYSVLGIEDPPSFDADDLRAHYEPHVFDTDADGVVMVGRNTVEFTHLIGGCFVRVMEVVALEVTQALQDWFNSVPLIADKPTAVRAFVQTGDGGTARTTGQLRGFRNGAELPESPLPPVNLDGVIDAKDNVEGRRGKLTDSLNFLLPDSWLGAGALTVRLELPGGQVCTEDPLAPCPLPGVEVTLQDASPAEVRMMAVSYPNDAGGLVVPGLPQLVEQRKRLRQLFPVPDVVHVAPGLVPLVEKPESSLAMTMVLLDLEFARTLAGDEWLRPDRRYYGGISGRPAAGPVGKGQHPWIGRSATGYLMDLEGRLAVDIANQSRYRNLVGHEIAHNFGIEHAVHSDNPKERLGTVWTGWCGERAGIEWGPQDFPFNMAIERDGELEQVATIGGTHGAAAVWGTDTRFMHVRAGHPGHQLALSDPQTTFALMSYCNPLEDGQGRWISRFNYERLAEEFGVTVGAAAMQAAGDPIDHFIVGGIIDLADGTAVLQPLVPASLPADGPEPGDYAIELFDLEGQLLESVAFEPGFDSHGFEEDRAMFVVPVSAPGLPIGKVAVTREDTEIAAVLASPSAPTVEIVAPGGGDELDGEIVELSWAGTDADGDELFYTVEYTADAGATWEPLAVNYAATSLSVPRYVLEGSEDARLRLTASDGIHTGVAVSDSFSVVDNAPVVVIDSPEDGAEFTGMQLVVLLADAFDPEDGQLSGASVTWTSDVDGQLGVGETLQLFAVDLSEGQHTITVTATDSAGNSVSETVQISIARLPTAGLEPPAGFQAWCEDRGTWKHPQYVVGAGWQPSDHPDLDHYNLYRQAIVDGEPSGDVRLVWSGTATYAEDPFVRDGDTLDYWATAVTSAGNESGPSVVRRVTVSSSTCGGAIMSEPDDDDSAPSRPGRP